MKKRQWITVVPIMAAVMAAMLALVAGAGYAFAQDPGGQNQVQGQNATPGPGGRMTGRHLAGGVVVKVEGNTITIKTLKTGEEKAVKVDDQTKYRKDGKDASLADVTAGEKIGILIGKKPAEGEDPLAKAIIIGKPGTDRQPPAVGTVGSVNGDKVTVQTAQGDKEVTVPAITQGMRIAVITAPDGTVRGVLYNPPEKPQGAPDEGAPQDAVPNPGETAPASTTST